MFVENFCTEIFIARIARIVQYSSSILFLKSPQVSVVPAMYVKILSVTTHGTMGTAVAAAIPVSIQMLVQIKFVRSVEKQLLPVLTMSCMEHIKAVIFMQARSMDKVIIGNINTIPILANGMKKLII